VAGHRPPEAPGGLNPGAITRRWASPVSLIFVALLVATPLWGPGIVNTRGGGDSPFLLQRTHQMLVNLRAGVFPVRWMPDAAYGLGYPFFSYYAALPYYLAGLLALAGLDLLTALKLVQTFGFIASALAMNGWMRGMTGSRWAAWLAAIAYTVAPFHLVNVYVRGDSLSEFYAFIFYPLVLWGLDKSCSRWKAGLRDSRSGIADPSLLPGICSLPFAATALAYAGLILTHNLSAFIFTPFALLYLAMLWLGKGIGHRSFIVCLLSLGFGALLAAWYWLPALAEVGLVQLGPSTQDYFHYSHHFRTLNLVQRHPLFDYSTAVDHTVQSPFAMGLVQAGLAVLGGLALVVRVFVWRRSGPVRGSTAGRPASSGAGPGRGQCPGPAEGRLGAHWGFVLVGLLLSTVMITPLSRPLWDYLPLLSIVQFPWRFLSVQALFTAAVTAALVPGAPSAGATRFKSALHLDVLALVALPIAALLVASVLLPLRPDRLPIGPADVTVERLQLYELFAGNIGTTIRYEWLPATVVPRPFTSNALIEPGAPPRAIPLDGASLEAALVERGPTRQEWEVSGGGGAVAFPLLYWPGWRARVDDNPVEVGPAEGSGYLALEVPPGEHVVLLRLGRTPVRAVAEVTSLGALVVLVALLLRVRREIRWPIVLRHLSFVILILVLLLLSSFVICRLSFSRLSREVLDNEADLTMDFDQMPYLHHNPLGIEFGGALRLKGYGLSSEELLPGDTLTVTLDYAGYVERAYTATVRLVSPAAIRHEVEPLAEAVCDLKPAATAVGVSCERVPLRVPEDIPRGVYLLQLRLFGSGGEVRARTPGGSSYGTLYLRPVRVPRGPSLPSEASILAPFGPAIRLHAAVIAQPAPDRLAVRLDWSVVHPVVANYGISIRLLDAEEHPVFVMDTQPGYGFLPTSLWRPGELIADSYLLTLPAPSPSQGEGRGEGPPSNSYHLIVILYQVSTGEAIGQARLGDFALPLETPFEVRRPPRSFSPPSLQYPLRVDFGGEIRLAGYDLEQRGDVLRLTLWWQASRPPQSDYTVFVHLFDPATEHIVAQSDAMPQGGMYPTSWWAAGEVVSETVVLPLEGVPQGAYRLAVGLYDSTAIRLPAVDSGGQPLPDDRLILPKLVEVKP